MNWQLSVDLKIGSILQITKRYHLIAYLKRFYKSHYFFSKKSDKFRVSFRLRIVCKDNAKPLVTIQKVNIYSKKSLLIALVKMF